MFENATIARLLRKARALVKAGRCQGTIARDSEGRPCGFSDPDATSFCAMGAILAVTVDYHICATTDAALALCRAVPAIDEISEISAWNDHPTTKKADVLSAFSKAAKRLLAQ